MAGTAITQGIDGFARRALRVCPEIWNTFFKRKGHGRNRLNKNRSSIRVVADCLQKEHASKEEIRTALVEAVTHIDTLDEEETQQWKRTIFYCIC